MSVLLSALADYDGKHKELLEVIRAGIEPGAGILDEAVQLASHQDGKIAAGATWLLRAWIETGAAFDAPAVRRLAAALPAIVDPWAQLHVCQAVRSLRVPKRSAAAFARYLQECRRSSRPFLRAWATDGLFHLAATHVAYAKAAESAVAAALEDEAPSVRARARHLREFD